MLQRSRFLQSALLDILEDPLEDFDSFSSVLEVIKFNSAAITENTPYSPVQVA